MRDVPCARAKGNSARGVLCVLRVRRRDDVAVSGRSLEDQMKNDELGSRRGFEKLDILRAGHFIPSRGPILHFGYSWAYLRCTVNIACSFTPTCMISIRLSS